MSDNFRWRQVEDDRQIALFSSPDEEAMGRRAGVGEFAGMEFLHVKAKRIINEVRGRGSMPFSFTINAYRGCSHACSYCFARPTHEYLGLGMGRDFDSKIVVKVNAVERVRAELRSPTWTGQAIAMGTNTDPYQRCEGKYRLTRGIIEELGEVGNPFSILTKSTLVTRDLDVLRGAAKRTQVRVDFSVPTLDVDVWRRTEPGTPHPRQRLAALTRLRAAGIESGVLIAPVLPGLSDRPEQIAEVAEASAAAGATWIAGSPLHLKRGLKSHWMTWLVEQYPQLVPLYEERYAGRAYADPLHRRSVSDVVFGVGRKRRVAVRTKMHTVSDGMRQLRGDERKSRS